MRDGSSHVGLTMRPHQNWLLRRDRISLISWRWGLAYDLRVPHRVLLHVDYLTRSWSLRICLMLLLRYSCWGLNLNSLLDWSRIRHLRIAVILGMLPPLVVPVSRLLIILMLLFLVLLMSSLVSLRLWILLPLRVLRLGEIDLFHSGPKHHSIIVLNTPIF